MTHQPLASALYVGSVLHQRVSPVRHRFAYRVFSLLIDLDEVDRLPAPLRHNRFGLLSFHDRDHGPGQDAPLAPWARARLADAGLADVDGPIRLLCFPRVLGFVFNPLSVWFCHRADGTLGAILHEVRNTFGEAHVYVIPAEAGADGLVRQAVDKAFYVSPFMDMDTRYHFRIAPPGAAVPDDAVTVGIHQTDAAGGAVLHASLTGRRVALTGRAVWAVWLRHPLMTLKVFGGIHLEALRLWRKGMTVRPRTPGPQRTRSVGQTIVSADAVKLDLTREARP